jgi:hypothetical protein
VRLFVCCLNGAPLLRAAVGSRSGEAARRLFDGLHRVTTRQHEFTLRLPVLLSLVIGSDGLNDIRCAACPGCPPRSSHARTRSQAAKVPVDWEHHTISTHAVTPSGDLISQVRACGCWQVQRRGEKGTLGLAVSPPVAVTTPSRLTCCLACPPSCLQEALDSVIRNKVGLKGPFATPIGKGHR